MSRVVNPWTQDYLESYGMIRMRQVLSLGDRIGLAFAAGLAVAGFALSSVGLAFWGVFLLDGGLFVLRGGEWINRIGWRGIFLFVGLLFLYVQGAEVMGIGQPTSVGFLVALLTLHLLFQLISLAVSRLRLSLHA